MVRTEISYLWIENSKLGMACMQWGKDTLQQSSRKICEQIYSIWRFVAEKGPSFGGFEEGNVS